MIGKRGKLGPVDYRVPHTQPILGYGGEEKFEREVIEAETEMAAARHINTEIYETGVVPAGVEIDVHASSHPAFSPDAWRAYQESNGVVIEPVAEDSADKNERIARLEAALEIEKNA